MRRKDSEWEISRVANMKDALQDMHALLQKIASERQPWSVQEVKRLLTRLQDPRGYESMRERDKKPSYVTTNIAHLRRLRQGQELTAEQLAKAAGVSMWAICNLERGYVSVSQQVYNKLAGYFGWKVWE